jgi:hypothetical protein
MYVVNLVDTGVFRGLGKPPNEKYEQVKHAVEQAGARFSQAPGRDKYRTSFAVSNTASLHSESDSSFWTIFV